MSFKTQVIWNWPIDDSIGQQINTRKVQLHEAGRRVGPVDERIEIDEPDKKTVIHEWVDESTAQEWIDFVSQFGPISATILE